MKLEEGEVICNKCKGVGVILHNNIEKIDYNCGKCNGTGKTDWITNAMTRNFVWVKPGVYTKEVDVSLMIPNDDVELFFEGEKILETTVNGITLTDLKK